MKLPRWVSSSRRTLTAFARVCQHQPGNTLQKEGLHNLLRGPEDGHCGIDMREPVPASLQP